MNLLLTQGNALRIPLADESVHCVVTSPPYFNAKEYSSWESYQDYLSDMLVVWQECYRVLCDGGRIAVNVPQGYDRPGNGGYKTLGGDITSAIREAGFELRGHIIWNKMGRSPQSKGTQWGSWMSASNPSLRDGHEIIIVGHRGSPGRTGGESTIDRDTFLHSTKSVWDIPPESKSWHPAPFPPEIPRRLIELYTFLGDVVLDPFSGSGTTVKVANDLGRRGIGIDIKMDYLRRSDVDRIKIAYWLIGHHRFEVAGQEETTDLPMFEELT